MPEEIIEAQEKFSKRQSEIKPESQPLKTESPVEAPEGNWLSKLFKLGKRKAKVVPPQLSEVAIDKQGNAVHGIGSEVTEEDLSKLEGKTKAQASETEGPPPGPTYPGELPPQKPEEYPVAVGANGEPRPLPSVAQKELDKLMAKYDPPGGIGEDSGLDSVGSETIPQNPAYSSDTAPSNVIPISKSVGNPPPDNNAGNNS